MQKRFVVLFAVGLAAIMLGLSCGGDGSTNTSKPDRITAVNGAYYHAVMGSLSVDKSLTFKLTDKSNNAFANRWLRFTAVEGDGTFSVDSAKTDASGQATALYTFGGALGHAVIRVSHPGASPADVLVRASTIIPGAVGQGQYVLFTDRYRDVKDFNGLPASVDVDPNYYINYANYEAAKGVVVILEDSDQDEVADDSENVIGVILTATYTGKTADSIGNGSTLSQVRAAYGPPDTLRLDPSPPPAVYIRYLPLGMTLYGTRTTDTTIFEIHVTEDVATPTPMKQIGRKDGVPSSTSGASFRQHRN